MTLPAPIRSLLDVALRYAGLGWHLFPIKPRAKQPLVAHGFLEATDRPEQLRAWWSRWPQANIGLAPGRSGLVVLDIDGPDGESAAQRLSLLAEPTLSAATGREGGRHLFFRRPAFAVSNNALALKLDVRGDVGYVLLAPSIHPNGRAYAWETRGIPPAELPPAALDALRAVQAGAPVSGRLAAAAIPELEAIPDGARNETLTRYVGRLLAKGHSPGEAYEVALALNDTRCRPPLAVREVWAIVQSLAARELRKPIRTTDTGAVLRIEGPTEPESPPDFRAMATTQRDDAIARGRLDLSTAPRFRWTDLHALVGEMLPGELWLAGALQGNGKTAFLMSQMDYFATQGMTTLYLPLEMPPKDARRRWAAWKLQLDPIAVARNQWHKLPEGSQDAHEAMLAEQADNPHIHFPEDKEVTVSRLDWWVRHAIDQVGARVVVIDHFHRMDFGAAREYRVQVTLAVKQVKNLLLETGIVCLASAQLNQAPANPLDRYMPPLLPRLKESAGFAEEADVVLMLSRRLKQVTGRKDMAAIRAGLRSERDLAEPDTMAVTCRKHRIADALAGDRTVLLAVAHGRVEDRAPDWLRPPGWQPE